MSTLAAVAFSRQSQLFAALDAVQHGEFDLILWDSLRRSPLADSRDQFHVVRSQRGAHAGPPRLRTEKPLGQVKIIFIDVRFFGISDFRGLVVGAFHQAHGRTHGNQANRGPFQCGRDRPARRRRRSDRLCARDVNRSSVTST